MQHIQKAKLEPVEVMTLYDVKAIFTSVPVDPSINIAKQNLLQEPTLPQRTNMSILEIITLLEYGLKTYTSSSKVSIMNRFMVLPWVPPISLLIANLSMEEFEVKALSSAHTPTLWLKYVDDTFIIQEAEHNQQLL